MKNKILASMQKEASEFIKDPKNKMREWWDKWWEFMKDPKNKIREWWNKWWEFMKDSKKKMRKWWDKLKFKHPWKACSLQYGVLALVVLGCHVLSRIVSGMTNVDYFRYPLSETFRHPFNLTANLMINKSAKMDTIEIYAAEMYADNARSILCTLVGSEAAIVAIVVSLTLIAIELTASAYSPRVIKISLKNPDMWILLLIYGVAIFSSIILLKQLPYESRFPTEDVSLAFWLGVFSYVALVPYLWNIPQLLDPTNIVKRVSADIEKDKLSKYIKDQEGPSKPSTEDSTKKPSMTNRDTEGHEENPIQPILDIVYRSINNYDLETVRNGLEEIVTLGKKVIVACNRDNAPGKDNEKLLKKQMRFSEHFCDPLKRISGLAASKDDEGSTREVIKKLQTFGEKTADKQLKVATEQVAVTLGAVGEISARKGKAFEDAVTQVAESLEEVGKAATGEGFEEATIQVASSLGAVGKTAIQKGTELEEAVAYVLKSLKDVGMQVLSTHKAHGKTDARKNGFEEVIKQVAFYLGSVGKSAAENKLDEATKEAALSLEAVGKTAADNGLKKATEQAAKSLGVVGEDAAKNQLDKATEQAAKSLGVVGEDAAKNQLDKATEQAAESLGVVGAAAAKEEGLIVAAEAAIESLKNVGEVVVKKEYRDVAIQIVRSLEVIGTTAANAAEKLEDVAGLTASTFEDVCKYAADNAPVKVAVDIIQVAVEALTNIKEIAEKKQLEAIEEIKLHLKYLESLLQDLTSQLN